MGNQGISFSQIIAKTLHKFIYLNLETRLFEAVFIIQTILPYMIMLTKVFFSLSGLTIVESS
jgi:hypothetical protein